MKMRLGWLNSMALPAVMLLAGCNDRIIDQAAEETKQVVDKTAEASKKASVSSEKLLKDANREAGKIMDRVDRATDGGVQKLEDAGKEVVNSVGKAISPRTESKANTDGTVPVER